MLAGFISGLAAFKFKGRYNIRRSLGFTILGIATGTLLGFLGFFLAVNVIVVNFIVIGAIYIVADLLLLPILLVSYHKIVARRKRI
jgi:biotin transporter BioY